MHLSELLNKSVRIQAAEEPQAAANKLKITETGAVIKP